MGYTWRCFAELVGVLHECGVDKFAVVEQNDAQRTNPALPDVATGLLCWLLLISASSIGCG
jgi:hypothetical protein